MKLINSIKKKIREKLDNRGSSIVMVVVALGFIGIIVGALLMAAGSAYRLKLQQMYAQDNFYYVEQAMQEIYASVGTQTVTELKEAYSYTIENMVYYDTDEGSYVTISDEEANQMFKSQFMTNIAKSDYFGQSTSDLANNLAAAITNDSVVLDKKKLSVVTSDDAITIKDVTLTRTQEYAKSLGSGTYTQTISADIVISEPDFEVDFNNSTIDYSTIFDYALIADMGVEIHQNAGTPLTIKGNIYAASDYYNKSYDFSLTDTGVEEANLNDENFSAGTDDDGNATDTVKGTYKVKDASGNDTTETETVEYDMSSVTNKTLLGTIVGTAGINMSADDGFVNDNVYGDYTDSEGNLYTFDGENERSKYSGLYITGSNVSIMADSIIVPGSVAVMNSSELTVYGMSGSDSLPQVWADDIVLGGTSTGTASGTGNNVTYTYEGSSATFRANLFVKDDTQIDAEGSSFTLSGSYYGYSDGTSKDNREFIATVDPDHFKMVKYDTDGNIVYKDSDGNETTNVSKADKDSDGNVQYAYQYNRGHYNSSSIVINGENSNLDLTAAEEIFIAGRAYVELSKYGTSSTATEDGTSTKTTTYEYVNDSTGQTGLVEDYKTGESIATKTSQLIYVVSNFGTVSSVTNSIYSSTDAGGNKVTMTYDAVDIPDTWDGVGFDDDDNDSVTGFGDFFPKQIFDGNLPVIKQTIKNRDYVFIDFETAYEVISGVGKMTDDKYASAIAIAKNIVAKYPSVDDYQSAYAVFYAAESLKGETSNYASMLSDIYAYTDFTQGDISFTYTTTTVGKTTTTTLDSDIYSSGAISMKLGNTFTMTTANDTSVVSDLLLGNLSTYIDSVSTETEEALYAADLSDDLEMEYNYMKWNLAHYKDNSTEKQYIKDLVKKYGGSAITPINKYMIFSNIGVAYDADGKKTNAKKNIENYVINSGSDNGTAYRIWATDEDVVVTATYKTTVVDADGNETETTKTDSNVTGIIITTGDVSFSDDVKTFTGMIIAGGKIYVGENMTNISSAAATCREILRQCVASDTSECKSFVNIFREYNTEDADSDDAAATTPATETEEAKVGIDTIGYTDVVSIENWVKNVGGAYDED